MREDFTNKVVLCLPFMQIASGHHHVAETLIKEFNKFSNQPTCHKVDILSYSYGHLEKVVSSVYLTWIKALPRVYDWLYKHSAYRQTPHKHRYVLYELMFTPFLKQLIHTKRPHVIFCTHALPSYIVSNLKQNNQIHARTVNVYTDFFINHIWGIKGIDFHLVPTFSVKKELIKRGVQERQIFITGIPIDRQFNQPSPEPKNKKRTILVSGGNLGVGGLRDIIFSVKDYHDLHYYVLCGKNERLYHEINRAHLSHVTPFPYITCREKMNQLYNKVDGVLTKPGGVTISECLLKRKPTFIYQPLPGQEKINVQQLTHLGLVIPITKEKNIEQQMLDFFNSFKAQEYLQRNLDDYHNHLDTKELGSILENLLHTPSTHH